MEILCEDADFQAPFGMIGQLLMQSELFPKSVCFQLLLRH